MNNIEEKRQEIWQTHLSGDSTQAAQLAKKLSEQLHFSSADKFETWRLHHVTALSASKKELRPSVSLEMLTEAIEAMLLAYPFGESKAKASQKGKNISEAYGEIDPTIISLRDLKILLDYVGYFYKSDQFEELDLALNTLMTRLYEENNRDRFLLLYQIEFASYQEAKKAFLEFVDDHAQNGPDGVITIVTRFMGRAKQEKDQEVMSLAKNVLDKVADTPQLQQFRKTEEAKNLNLAKKEFLLSMKTKLFLSLAGKQNVWLRRLLNMLSQQVFVGFSDHTLKF